MACCDDKLATPRMHDMRDLPSKTFCCMGRAAYMLCVAAEEILIDNHRQAWDTLSEEDKLRLGEMAKTVACEDQITDGWMPAQFIRLFTRVIQTMTTAP